MANTNTNTAEQFIDASQSSLKTLQELTEQAHASAEAWTALQLAASRAQATVSARHVEASLQAKDPQQWLSLQADFAKSLGETTAQYGQQLYSLVAGAGLALSKTVETHLEESKGVFADTVQAAKTNFSNAAQSAVETINSKPARRK